MTRIKDYGIATAIILTTLFLLGSSYNNYVPPVNLLSNSGAYAAITNTVAQTYFAVASDGLIPSGAINAAKHRIEITLHGLWSTNNNSDTVTLAIALCTVSGCGSGTVTPIIGSVAVAANGGPVTNVGWMLNLDCNVYTAGTSGTLDCQGYESLNNATTASGSPATFRTLFNTSTLTINTSVNEYISPNVTWSAQSTSDTITLTNFSVKYY